VPPSDGPVEYGGIPPAEVTVDERLIRVLLGSRHPDLYQLGDRLAVRLPRIRAAAPLIAAEQTWLPWLASRLPVTVPVPVRQGRAGADFPRNDYRGVPLANLDETQRGRLDALSDDGLVVPAAAVRERWDEAVRAPIDVAATCIHGDLHPRNLVVDQGRLADDPVLAGIGRTTLERVCS
jgi:aminoglycoside phosphotransferase (APT) family kinase protein